MAVHDAKLIGIEQLKIPVTIRKDLKKFVLEVLALYRERLVSITVFGSAVSGDYKERSSDLNLLIVHSELNVSDLREIARLAQWWLKRRRFAPRFISRRNLVDSARYFQVDLLEMRDAHVVLYGEDVLSALTVQATEMRWQLAHEIKAMRMRIKQQFWRTAGRPPMMRAILLQRFSSLIHLMRVLLFLKGKAVPPTHRAVVDQAVTALGIDASFAEWLFELKRGRSARGDELIGAFDRLMDMIRTIDHHVDALTV